MNNVPLREQGFDSFILQPVARVDEGETSASVDGKVCFLEAFCAKDIVR